MPLLHRLQPILLALLFCLPASATRAADSILPDEGELNRLGLTMSWWAQSAINPRRDQVSYFTADEQNVYVQSSTGILTTFHGEQGRQLWSQLIGMPNQQAFPVTTNDKEVMVTVGLQMFSMDKFTGRTLWILTMDEYPSTSPSVDETHIFVGCLDGSVLAYDMTKVQNLYSEGLLPKWTVRAWMWNFQTPKEIVSPPIPAGNDVVFASERGVVYSLSKENKELRYQFEAGAPIWTPLGRSRDQIFVATRNARMICMNIDDGHVKWTFSGGALIRQQPRVVGHQVFVVPHREGLTALSTSSGIQQWQQKLATSFVAASETRVYASDSSNNLLVIDRETGRLIGTLNLRNFPIRVANDRTDRIFLSSEQGTIIALREIGSDYPDYHLYPERRPILPELATDEDAQKKTEESN